MVANWLLVKIMNANFVITGSLIIVFSFGLFTNIGAGKRPAIGSILLGVFGVGEVVTAAFPCDPGCPLLISQSLSQSIHSVIAVIAFGSIAIGPTINLIRLEAGHSLGALPAVFSSNRTSKCWTLPILLRCNLLFISVRRLSATRVPCSPLHLDRNISNSLAQHF